MKSQRVQEEQTRRLEARNRELMRTLRLSEEARVILADQYDYAPVGFVTLDMKGCVRAINLTATRMLGCERTPVLAMPFFTHIAKSHVRTFLSHLRECRRHSCEVICEVALRVRAGGALPVELRSVPVFDPRHGDTVYRTTIIDISERLRLNEALQQSEKQFRELTELSPDAIFIITLGRVEFANPSALRLCGIERINELIGGEFAVRGAQTADRARLRELLLHAANVQEALLAEARFAHRGGPAVDAELIARSFHHQQKQSVLVVVRDISRRKAAERHVLEISERERQTFGREVHDGLCQTLMAAALLADGLRKEFKDTSPRAAQMAEDLAHAIRSSGEEARRLARGLCPVTMEKHGLVAALRELAAHVGTRARVDCTAECDDALILKDVNRATHVYRIAQEAVNNAIRHGRAKSIRIRMSGNNGRIALSVEDDGKGFPAKPKRIGMGLHTMQYRASLIGGSVEVRRARPRGTIVTCTFPTLLEIT
jgi:PAS domain S-box-containing protein